MNRSMLTRDVGRRSERLARATGGFVPVLRRRHTGPTDEGPVKRARIGVLEQQRRVENSNLWIRHVLERKRAAHVVPHAVEAAVFFLEAVLERADRASETPRHRFD